ncbi:fermitin family homolog 2-like isoform X2 [Pocillopora verrucosa]|uniref:fermitin family homolog 2-like isoform X2 n=1 Tax=Pocillopora verrucosa TaxID=203993 RepID=UPI0027979A83|nr:fermitin family homolog 2-like isoform X2 [Pocillopora verrucosa]
MSNLGKKSKWNLSVFITNLSTEKSVEVNGETHVGKLMLDLVEGLDIAADWSDHGLWWPQKRQWLLKPRLTLDTIGVQGDAVLQFTPTHKKVRVQLPDLQYVEVSLDFSKPIFHAVQELCTELGIRHPEELSLLKPYEGLRKEGRRSFRGKLKKRHSQSSLSSDDNLSTNSDDKTRGSKDSLTVPNYNSLPRHGYSSPNGTLNASSPVGYSSFTSDGSCGTIESTALASSPVSPSIEAISALFKPKTLQEKAVVNKGWMDSSRSLMAQEVAEFSTLLLRYKYYAFFDLNPKVDEVRINQLYEQAKWSILTEEVECTEEEMLTFAAIQFQVKLTSTSPQNQATSDDDNDDIDAALNDLQATLEGSSLTTPGQQKSLTSVPEIKDYLHLVKHKTFGSKKKKYWFVFKDTILSLFKSQEEAFGQAVQKFNLRGCEIIPDVNVNKEKFNFKVKLQESEDIEICCSCESQYSKWMAACRLASKGKTMADSGYDAEVSGIQAFLSMQHDKGDATPLSPGQIPIQPEDFVGPRMLKKYKAKQIAARILEAHSSLNKSSLVESKMLYVRQWQALPEFGLSHFVVRFRGSKKEEILGIAFNRIMRIDPTSREALKTWRYSVMKAWNVNWETREMVVQCEGETITFACTSADIKVIHEFIGGYIFMSMRKDVNQPSNEELFFKLTGGWV